MEEKVDFIKFNCYNKNTGEIYPCIVNRYSILDAFLIKNFEIEYWDYGEKKDIHVKFVDCVQINLRVGAGKCETHYLAEDINDVIDILSASNCS